MKLSTKARYGLRAVLDLAEHYGSGPVQAKLIAQRQEISPKYLEHLLAVLKARGIVRVVRGARGGYELARPPQDIALGEVVRGLEGSLYLVECVQDPNVCPRTPTCIAREVWQQMKEALEQILDNTSIGDLVAKQQSKRAAAVMQLNYDI